MALFIGETQQKQISNNESWWISHLQEAKRWHCGEFRVYADNENGEDVASIEVTVTCKYLFEYSYDETNFVLEE